MYLPKTPEIAKKLFPKLTWQQDNKDKAVYLTFDDGPTPGVTEWVLNQLNQYNAKATFFCLGKNVVTYPDIFEELLRNGHSVGNHTFNHLNCWETPKARFLNDIASCEKVFHSKFFRPPYGKLKPGLRSKILEQYKIIMWDVMSYDFDQSISAKQCADNVMRNITNGSIIVFHDSLKAQENLKHSLPSILKALYASGVQMKAL
jgi:peptidoglycan/xylan/chitin deacetylase (PgdA/CDA1 family)